MHRTELGAGEGLALMFEQEIQDVLAKLSMLSEVSAASLEPHTSGSATESSVPGGVSQGDAITPTDPDRPPPKERSLFDWYVWKFQRHADEPERLVSLLLLAERDYLSRRFHVARSIELRSGQLTENDVMDGGKAERAAAERVCEWYVGLSPLAVAIEENVTEAWVKKARRQNGRNPDDGRPLPEFYGWHENVRRERVALLAESMSQGKAADHLGVDRKTVKRYWPAPAEDVTVAA